MFRTWHLTLQEYAPFKVTINIHRGTHILLNGYHFVFFRVLLLVYA